MSDEQIKQRIAYLVEHGGVYEDPLDDVRRQLRWINRVLAAAVVANAVILLLLLV